MDNTTLLIKSPLDDDESKFYLKELEGVEQISGLFHYKLVLRSEDNLVDFAKIVGKQLTVTVCSSTVRKRFINGVVTRFIQSGYDGKITIYHAELRPWLWHLALTLNSKIFQNSTATEIISATFKDLGFTDFEDKTTGVYEAREYCVQYQESALKFVTRLLEEEGIFYFFKHTESGHTLVLADDADNHQACPDLKSARVAQVDQGRQIPDDIIERCSYEQQLVPNKYSAKDFNYLTPDTDLLASVDGSETGKLTVYDYPGKYTGVDQGEGIIKKRMESFELPQKIMRGQGFCRTFTAGYKFELKDHEREEMNAQYVLRNLTIWATQDRYSNSFEAFPATTPFRPRLITEKPRIIGTQTAIIVGKSDEEIWTDKYGRVKIQFHWDQEGKKDENSSCWVRVAQVWAGKNWGTLFIPRIGTEVIVSFLEGDPDQPIIIGTVYNAKQTTPYTLPDDKNISSIKTRSTKEGSAGNEIRFDDTKDSEELYIHAQKDMLTEIENDATTEIKNDRKTTIKEGKDTLAVNKGDREVNVKTGKEDHKNKANFTHKVGGDYVLQVKGNITMKATGNITIKGAMVKIN